MAYNQKLAGRIRKCFATLANVEEKEMMGGLIFMLNDKMCIGIIKDEMMCRIDFALDFNKSKTFKEEKEITY